MFIILSLSMLRDVGDEHAALIEAKRTANRLQPHQKMLLGQLMRAVIYAGFVILMLFHFEMVFIYCKQYPPPEYCLRLLF